VRVLLIGYDQATAAANNAEDSIVAKIKAQPSWARILPNLYTVTTTLTAPQLRDQMLAISNAKLVVFDVTNSLWATNSVSTDATQWLQSNWRQS
jgi:hypothetical protein